MVAVCIARADSATVQSVHVWHRACALQWCSDCMQAHVTYELDILATDNHCGMAVSA
jgi:hypothetical protein